MQFPDEDGWIACDPASVGVDPDALAEAVDYHRRHGTPHEQVNYDFGNLDTWDDSEGEYGERIGPMPPRRGGPSGMVLKDGRPVAEWGDTRRVDHAFSVAKSVLSLVAGLAVDRGLIDDVDDPVGEYVDDGGFESEHNRTISWRQLLEGTSEWEGTLFGKPDSVDRNRAVGKGGGLDKSEGRQLREPGTFWEYNDVRINRLALSLLRVLGRPLPRVLAEGITDPIGTTGTWEWHGYYNSTVDVDGTTMRSVSGGGHWGGGLWISTRDLARIGLLVASGGEWSGRQLLSSEWIDAATTPSERNPNYGFLWWLNTDRTLWPDAPASAFAAIGFGQNVLWIDPADELVVVLRWLHTTDERAEGPGYPEQNEVFRRIIAATE